MRNEVLFKVFFYIGIGLASFMFGYVLTEQQFFTTHSFYPYIGVPLTVFLFVAILFRKAQRNKWLAFHRNRIVATGASLLSLAGMTLVEFVISNSMFIPIFIASLALGGVFLANGVLWGPRGGWRTVTQNISFRRQYEF